MKTILVMYVIHLFMITNVILYVLKVHMEIQIQRDVLLVVKVVKIVMVLKHVFNVLKDYLKLKTNVEKNVQYNTMEILKLMNVISVKTLYLKILNVFQHVLKVMHLM